MRRMMRCRWASTEVLTSEDIAHFREEGWLVKDPFFEPDHLRAIRASLEEIHAGGRLANVSTEGDGKTKGEVRNLQICPLSPESDLFRSLPFHPKVSEAMRLLLCDEDTQSVTNYLSQAFWKPPSKGLGTSYHQDNAYFQVSDGSKGAAVWIAVHDATVSNGTLHVARGMHKKGVLPHRRDLASDHHITCDDHIPQSAEVPLEVKAGGVAFFNLDVPHCTKRNATSNSRAAVAYHFVRSDFFRDRAFPLPEDADWRTPVVAGPESSGGVREYGVACDTFQRDADAVLAKV